MESRNAYHLSATSWWASSAYRFGAVLAVAWAWRSQTPWREIGYVRPRSWLRTIAVGIAFGVAFKFFMKRSSCRCSAPIR